MLRAVRSFLNFKHAKEVFFSRDIVKHGAIVENYPVTTPIYIAIQNALIALIRKERKTRDIKHDYYFRSLTQTTLLIMHELARKRRLRSFFLRSEELDFIFQKLR